MSSDDAALKGISHVSLSVTDIDRSLVFYRDVLGLPVLTPVIDGIAFEGRQAMVLVGRIGLALQEHRANSGADFDPARTGMDHLSFHVSSKDDLESWRTKLAAANVEVSEVRDVAFGSLIEFRDPDGIQLELFALD